MRLNRVTLFECEWSEWNGFTLDVFDLDGDWSLFGFGLSKTYISVEFFGLTHTWYFSKELRKMLKK